MNLTKITHCSISVLISIILHLTLSPIANAQEVPANVYKNYLSLSKNFSEMSDKVDNELKDKSEKKLFNDIALFYQKQLTHSSERQLLASNLHLQVLLMQQRYQESYQVVSHLLSLLLSLDQQLNFEQLAAQLAAQFVILDEAKSNLKKTNKWNIVEQHLKKWFLLQDKFDRKQKETHKITKIQEANNAALLAQAYYLQNKLNAAITPAKRAYYLFPKKESYLKFLLALLQNLEKHQQQNKYLAIAVIDFPLSKDYWERLAYSYLALNNQKLALSTLTITRIQGLLTTQGYTILSSLYLQQQQPRMAAEVYQEGASKKLLKEDKDYFQGLMNAWLMAQERSNALLVLKQAEKAGFKLIKHNQQQAQLLYLEARWPEAELAYSELLSNEDSSLSKQENALLISDNWLLMLAMSQLEQNKKEQAKKSLLQLQTERYQKYSKGLLDNLAYF